MCDGMFLILDTAKHGGWEPDSVEIEEHIKECAECQHEDAYQECEAQ